MATMDWAESVMVAVETAERYLAVAQKTKIPAEKQVAWKELQKGLASARATLDLATVRSKDEKKVKAETFLRRMTVAYVDRLEEDALDIDLS